VSPEVNAVLPESQTHSHETWNGDNLSSLTHIALIATSIFSDCHIWGPLETTTIGWIEPLSLTLSPLRGARELANRLVVASRCARWIAGGVLGMGQAEEEISLWWGVGHGVIDNRAGVIAPSGRGEIVVGLERPTG
jgi:hypothetical protein